MSVKTRKITICFFFLFLAIIGCASSREEKAAVNATLSVEESLTADHGEEAAEVIESYLLRMRSYEAYANPEILKEIMTGPYLDDRYRLRQKVSDEEDSWHIAGLVEIDGVRVLAYSDVSFKALACGETRMDSVSSSGDLLEEQAYTMPIQTVFVFTNEDDKWKVAAEFNMIDYDHFTRDWESVPYWEKEILGDVPGYLHRQCISIPFETPEG